MYRTWWIGHTFFPLIHRFSQIALFVRAFDQIYISSQHVSLPIEAWNRITLGGVGQLLKVFFWHESVLVLLVKTVAHMFLLCLRISNKRCRNVYQHHRQWLPLTWHQYLWAIFYIVHITLWDMAELVKRGFQLYQVQNLAIVKTNHITVALSLGEFKFICLKTHIVFK